jgi:hypothetical protein
VYQVGHLPRVEPCVYTVFKYSWWWTVDLSETRRVLYQIKHQHVLKGCLAVLSLSKVSWCRNCHGLGILAWSDCVRKRKVSIIITANTKTKTKFVARVGLHIRPFFMRSAVNYFSRHIKVYKNNASFPIPVISTHLPFSGRNFPAYEIEILFYTFWPFVVT